MWQKFGLIQQFVIALRIRPQTWLFLWVITSSQAQFIQPDLFMSKPELIIVSLLLNRVQVCDLPMLTYLLPVLAGVFSFGRTPEMTHSKCLIYHIRINIRLIIYDTAGLPRKAWGIVCS